MENTEKEKNEKSNIPVESFDILKSSIDNSPNLTIDKAIVYDVNDLINESYSKMEYVGETIETISRDLLANYNFEVKVRNFYAYLMREIMRNVVEHSGAKTFEVKLYSNKFNEFGFKVIDEGIGIRKSLNLNPSYHLNDDLTALIFCIKPGITRSYKRDPYRDAVWQNSGFGLHMVSHITKRIGKFEICSGNARLLVKEISIEPKKYKIKGTEVTVIINSNIKIDIPNIIKEASLTGSKMAANSYNYSEFAKFKTASKASTLLKDY